MIHSGEKCVDEAIGSRQLREVPNSERPSTVYLVDFIKIDGERHFISADVRSGKVRIEHITDDVFEQFIRNVLLIGEDGSLPAGGLPKLSSEVSA